jgi:hypothetical protein
LGEDRKLSASARLDAIDLELQLRERAESERAFAELRRVWVRPWPDNDDAEARRALAKALEDADADTIIAAASEWVRLADAPRFLAPLPRWLADRCWERDPPQRRTRARAAPSGKQRKPNLREMALRAGAWRRT